MPKRRPNSVARRKPDETTDQTGCLQSPLNHRAAFLARLAQLRSFDEFHKQFAGLGVTPTQFSVFALIVENPGVRPGAIAEELRIKPSNVAVMVTSLVAAGLAERTQDATELRANVLHVTRAGTAAWRQMERAADEVEASFLEGLTSAEARQFTALLRKLLHR